MSCTHCKIFVGNYYFWPIHFSLHLQAEGAVVKFILRAKDCNLVVNNLLLNNPRREGDDGGMRELIKYFYDTINRRKHSENEKFPLTNFFSFFKSIEEIQRGGKKGSSEIN